MLVAFFAVPGAPPKDVTLKQKLLEVDIIGTALILGSVVCYIIALQKAGVTDPWSSSVSIGLLVGFGVLAIIFYIGEWKMKERAMVSFRLLKNRVILVNFLLTFFFAGNYFVTLYFLPIYFQVVDNASPTSSGVHNLPYIISFTILMIVSGGLLTFTGRATALAVISSILLTIGSGLFIILDIGSSSGKWIGFQIIAGLGIGAGYNIPASAVQMILPMEDITIASSMIICKSGFPCFMLITRPTHFTVHQMLGGSLLVSAGQSILENVLAHHLTISAPTLDPKEVLLIGATNIRSKFPPEVIPGIVEAYMKGLKATFIFNTVLAGIALLLALLGPWQSLIKKA